MRTVPSSLQVATGGKHGFSSAGLPGSNFSGGNRNLYPIPIPRYKSITATITTITLRTNEITNQDIVSAIRTGPGSGKAASNSDII